MVNDASSPSGISSPYKPWIPSLNHLLDGDLCKKNYCHIFYSFLVSSHDFIMYIDFTRVEASNAATDHISNCLTYSIFSTNLEYSCGYFILEIYEKYSFDCRFLCDLMMLLDSGLLFGHPLHLLCTVAILYDTYARLSCLEHPSDLCLTLVIYRSSSTWPKRIHPSYSHTTPVNSTACFVN